MKQELKVPRMGESISEATIGNILKPTGSKVKTDDEILELETEKVNQVVFAPTNGQITLTVSQGQVVKIDEIIGYIETEAKEEVPEPKKSEAPTQKMNIRKGKEEFIADIKKPKEEVPPVTPQPKKPEPSKTEERTEKREKLPKIRRVIAERLVAAQHNAAMLTTFNEVDLTQVIILKERYKDLFQREYQVKLGYMPFFVEAVVSALQAFPEVNAYLEGEDLVYRNYYDIGIAVSTERGLVVPILRDADKMKFGEIEQNIDYFATKARQGNLAIEDLQGGSFTITNGGVFGSLLSTPILNPPQTAILGMHKIVKRPVAINDQVMIRPMMYLALTYDHRVIDGREAVSFLVHIKQCLEDPARILLEI